MISSFTLLKKTFALFVENPKRYLLIMAVPALISFFTAILEPNIDVPELDVFTLSTFVLVLFVSLVVSVLMTIALVHAVADTSLSVGDAYKKAQKQFFKYILLILGMTGLLFVAFLLLIIPGIWLSVAFSFAIYFSILRGSGVKQALSESMALVKGRWWAVATRSLVLSLVGILFFVLVEFFAGMISSFTTESFGYAVSTVLGLLATPFATIYMYELFLSLQERTPMQADGSATPAPAEAQVQA